MAYKETTFADRVARIERARSKGLFRRRRARRMPRGVVMHPDGVITYNRPRERRFSFAFPLRGLMLAFALIVAVKAFLMSAIGMEAYGAAVAQLLAGSDLERVAGLILAPDAVSLWVVDGYEAVSRLVTDALARSAA